MFGFTEDIKGALLVTCDPELLGGDVNPDEASILATMRTYDVSSPVGTYGQTIPATAYVVNSYEYPSYITGARNDDRFRSNLGIVNNSLEEVTIHYRITEADFDEVAVGSMTLPSLSYRQWTFRSLGVGNVDGPLTVDLWLDPTDVKDPCQELFDGGTAFLAYVSKVDSDTEDAEFIYAAPPVVAEEECQ